MTMAQESLAEALRLYRQSADANGRAWATHNLGHIAVDAGDYDRAATVLLEALREWHRGRQIGEVASSIAGLASVAVHLGELTLAAQHCGSVDSMLAAARTVLSPVDDQTYRRNVAILKAQIGEDAYDAARLEAMRLTVDEVVSQAIQVWSAQDDGQP